jgi:hypothetical protein
MESIIKDCIMKHLTDRCLINTTQHGFWPKRSCLTNLPEFLEYVTKYVDSGYPIDVIYLDFHKAFDIVPHQRLLQKIRALGVGGEIICMDYKLVVWAASESCTKWSIFRVDSSNKWGTTRISFGSPAILDFHK